MGKVSCFIHKNTPELRKRIEKIGVKLCPCVTFHHAIWLDFSSEAGEHNTVHGAPMYDEDNMERNISCYLEEVQEEGSIDCGENEEMFLALIALRDDTDKNQWFIHDSMDCLVPEFREIEWYLCESDNYKDFFIYDCMFLDCRKATVEEIVEHFKTK